MTLRSTARPGVPADGSRLCDPDEGKAARPPTLGRVAPRLRSGRAQLYATAEAAACRLPRLW